MAAARQDRQPGLGNGALHHQADLEAGFLLVPGHDQRRYVEARHLAGQVVERGAVRLHARKGIRGAQRRMFVELADVIIEATGIFVLVLDAGGAVSVGRHERRHAAATQKLGVGP